MNTVTKPIEINGRGIHSGLAVRMVIKPSDKQGIYFKRVDIPDSELILAR